MRQFFPTLKRWKEKDERTLTEKATGLLAQCKDITIASIDNEGFHVRFQCPKSVQKDVMRYGWQPLPIL